MDVRKVLACSLTAITAGATLMFAAVASPGLGDYVKTDTNAITSPIIVIGAPAAPSADFAKDVIGAADIAAAIAGYATKPQTIAGVSGVSVTGGAAITSDLNKTYLNSSATLASVRKTLTATELPTLLATGEFTDKNSTTITYQQLIYPGAQYVAFDRPTGSTTPVLYISYATNVKYNTTVNFLGGLDESALDTTLKIKLFGSDFTFGPEADQSNTTLVMYSTAGATTLNLQATGGSKTINVAGKDYKVEMAGWAPEGCTGSKNGAIVKVDDVPTPDSMWCDGSTYNWPGTTVRVRVNSVIPVSTPTAGGGPATQDATAQLFVGTTKVKLSNGLPVEINDKTDATSNAMATISASGSKINSLTIQTAPSSEAQLVDGSTWKDPVWGTFSWTLSGMTPAMTSGRDTVSLAKSGNAVKMTWTNYEGTTYDTNTYYYSGSTFDRTIDGTNDFWVTEGNTTGTGGANNNITVGDYFALSRGDNSYIMKYNSYGTSQGVNYTVFIDASTGTSFKIFDTDPYIRIGANEFNVTRLADASAVIDLDGSGAYSYGTNVNLKTKTGAIINLTAGGNTTVVVENPLYTLSGSDPVATNITVVAAYSGNEVNLNSVTAPGSGAKQVGSTNKYEYVTSYGTHIATDTDADTVVLHYPGNRPAYANVAIGENPVITAGGATVETAVKIQSPVAKLASEINTAALTGDLILIGGPCANSLVATLMSADNVTCANWAYTKGIIKEYANAFNSGKKALVVAGTLAADTRELAAKVMQGTTSFSA